MSARTYDVAIVGAGIIGGAIAWELARAGLRVVLLDRQQAGMEASWAAAGMLAPGAETPDSVPVAPLGRASLALYPEFVAGIEADSGANVEFEPGDALQVFFDEAAERESEAFLALHREFGMRGEVIAPDLARTLEPELSRQARVAVLCEDEARVNGRALTAAVLEAAQRRGAELRAGSAVTSLEIAQGRVTGVHTASGAISAGRVVIAAGCWSGGLEQVAPYAPTRPVRGQMVALRSERVSLRHVLRSHSGYIVPRADGRLVCGSTAEPEAGFEKRVTPEGQQHILAAATELVPALSHAAVVETWSGLRPDTPDHLPSLGPTHVEGLLMATGHYRNGLLLAPITARLMHEWIIEGRAASFAAEPFSPLRFAGG
ncbi:MAG: glycine oxidase ThiO [Candidatus Acidiferrales bacterium]